MNRLFQYIQTLGIFLFSLILCILALSTPFKAIAAETLSDLDKRAQKGDTQALTQLARAFMKGEMGAKQDYASAAIYLKILAEKGDRDGQYGYGNLFANGYGVPNDWKEACRWFERAAANGHPQALEWLKMAAKKNYSQAKWALQRIEKAKVPSATQAKTLPQTQPPLQQPTVQLAPSPQQATATRPPSAVIPPTVSEPLLPEPLQAPVQITSPSPPQPQAPEPRSPEPQESQAVVNNVRGIYFVASQERVQVDGFTDLARLNEEGGVIMDGFTPPDATAFKAEAKLFLGKPLNVETFNQMRTALTNHYKASGQALVAFSLPEHSAPTGVMQILVTEGKAGGVRIEGNEFFSEEQLRKNIRQTPGAKVDLPQLEEDVRWLNRNPYRQAELVYEEGEDYGKTDITIAVKDRKPWRIWSGYNDAGNALTSDDRIFWGAQYANLWEADHRIMFQYTTEHTFDHLHSFFGNYVMPLPWRHELKFSGSYALSKSNFSISGFPLNTEGKSSSGSVGYVIPLAEKVAGEKTLDHNFEFGFEFKESNNSLETRQIHLSNTTTQVIQLVNRYSITLPDSLGRTTLSLTFTASPGGVNTHNSDTAYQLAGAGDSQYCYGRMDLSRNTEFPHEFAWNTDFAVQKSSTQLLGSEQFGIGGSANLRGYEERESNGDFGVYLTNELVAPAWEPGKLFEGNIGNFRLFSFIDYGHIEKQGTSFNPNVDLLSTGGGIRWQLSPYAMASFAYGVQLQDSGEPLLTRSGENHRGHFSVMVSY